MTAKTETNLVNMSDATVLNVVATGFSGATRSALRAALTGAIFLRLKGDGATVRGLLQDAIRDELAGEGATDAQKDARVATAKNYAMRCGYAALPDNWRAAGMPETCDVNQPLKTIVDGLVVAFSAYWGSINEIKKAGKGAKGASRGTKAEGKAEGKAEEGNADNMPPLPGVVAYLTARLGTMGEDGQPVLAAKVLAELADAVAAELAKRADTMAEAELAAEAYAAEFSQAA